MIRRHRPDYQILLFMGLLMLVGLIVMYAIGPQRANVLNNAYGTDYYNSTYFFIKQTFSLILALVAFGLAATVPYELLLKNARKILIIGFIACGLLFIFGNLLHVDAIAQCSLGACRWYSLGPLGTLQPAEFLKFGILLFAAGFLGVRANQGLINDRDQTLIPMAIITGLALFLIVGIQKDMGTGMTLIAILATMFIVAGMSMRTGMLLTGVVMLVGVIFILIAPHRIDRVTTFFAGDSASIDDGADYHVAHAKLAIGTGGFNGVGIGNSVEATGYLPEAINDSVFAIMGETFGFIGLVGILTMFTVLLLRVLKVSDHLSDTRLRILAAGIFGWLAAHVILNVGAMIGIIPLTGITLPLLSFGGTSMIFIAASLGIAFQLSRYTSFGKVTIDTVEPNEKAAQRQSRTWSNGRRSSQRRMSKV